MQEQAVHVLTGKPAGKTARLAEKGAFAGTREKQEFIPFGKRGRQLRKSTRKALSYLQQKLGKSSLLSFFPVTNEIEENGTCAPIPSTSYLSNLKSFLIALELLCLITDNSVHLSG